MTKLRDLKGFEDAFPGETLFVDEKGNENFGEYMDNISDVNVVVDEEILKGITQLRYYKLMYPEINESDAEIVAGVLVNAIIANLKDFIRLEKSDDK